jgi:hypothetical protein
MYETRLVREEFGKFWSINNNNNNINNNNNNNNNKKRKRKREVRLEPPTRVSGSIDQHLLSQILEELNRTDFEFEKSEDFRNFVQNPVDLDLAVVDQLENPVPVPVSSSSVLSFHILSFAPLLLLFIILFKRYLS